MNTIENDYGQVVIAVGAPGSQERVKAQYPKLINALISLYFQATSENSPGLAIDEAIQMIRDAGVRGRMETDNILSFTPYKANQ